MPRVPLNSAHPARGAIRLAYRQEESVTMKQLLEKAQLTPATTKQVQALAERFVEGIRGTSETKGLDGFLATYHLSSDEGIALMCVAEALLRIPDAATRDKLLKDKLGQADWQASLGKSDSFFVNAATWGLMLTGKVMDHGAPKGRVGQAFRKLVSRTGEPVIRTAVMQAMKILGNQFVLGRTIEEALSRARKNEKAGFCYSYDMLGESARTEADAERYWQSYRDVIDKIGQAAQGDTLASRPGISVKLSALHPRYEQAKRETVVPVLIDKLMQLALAAKKYNLSLTVDAEESERLSISLDIIEAVFCDASLGDWEGFGLAVQSYQKRAYPLLEYLATLTERAGRKLMVRLIKGAYWDSEIKHAQMAGFSDYPVFTCKAHTDISFQACAKYLFERADCFYPMFGTHNAYSAALVMSLAEGRPFEFQCLHGMGGTLYQQIVQQQQVPTRIYAPVGGHQELLAYLVRRLLENGANTSFVNRLADDSAPVASIIADPCELTLANDCQPNAKIPLPCDLYGDRKNSIGVDLSNTDEVDELYQSIGEAEQQVLRRDASGRTLVQPQKVSEVVGCVADYSTEATEQALQNAVRVSEAWGAMPVESRAQNLEQLGELLEEHRGELVRLCVQEAGKTVSNSLDEIREAVDFCRYYAMHARRLFAEPEVLVGPTGEDNQLSFAPLGPVLCISPWNFPLAIFLGQVTAALAAGNVVLAKPAEQTPLIALKVLALLHEAGLPEHVVQVVTGPGETVGAQMVQDSRIKGVVFTGSTQTAKRIQLALAQREGAIIPLIAETGGLNTMLVDSTALPEQTVEAVIESAFGSAGQRCSALRVLYLQADIADKFLTMLQGAMATLTVGDPMQLSTDIGPVIDTDARDQLQAHQARMEQAARLLYQVSLPAACESGTYFAPCVYELDSIQQLPNEVFGPFLHVIRYPAKALNAVIDDINATDYGLTLGIQSRISETIDHIKARVRVGNVYVNRNMVGAVVGVQPFGGLGLSGTGPKAGGPHYLLRLCFEKTCTINTTAMGGNASLLAMD